MATMHSHIKFTAPKWAPHLMAFVIATRLGHIKAVRDFAAWLIVRFSDIKFTAGDDA